MEHPVEKPWITSQRRLIDRVSRLLCTQRDLDSAARISVKGQYLINKRHEAVMDVGR
jgi:hypothetical protein